MNENAEVNPNLCSTLTSFPLLFCCRVSAAFVNSLKCFLAFDLCVYAEDVTLYLKRTGNIRKTDVLLSGS